MTDLIDEDDGENRAVRSFLALYGCNPGTTVGQMRKHLELSGFPNWPEWVGQVSQAGHLTKGGAQSWLRHLFGLEPTKAATAGWVSVGERLPPLGERVWIAAWAWDTPGGTRIYGVAIFDGKAWGNPQDPEQSATWWPPTHWMPLTEPTT